MDQIKSLKYFLMTIVVLLSLISPELIAAEKQDASPKDHSDHWLSAFSGFLLDQQELTEDQAEAVWDAIEVGSPAYFSQDLQKSNHTRLLKVVSTITNLFSTDQLGSLFKEMGSTQDYLLEVGALGTAYCNCTTLNVACNISPGTCKVGCISWEDGPSAQVEKRLGSPGGNAYVGICSN